MKTSSRMNMATRLIADALNSLDTKDVTKSLGGIAGEIVRLFERIRREKKRTLGSILEGYALSLHGRLDAYTVPDAIWIAICFNRPDLYCYPLGEITERATKKTVSSLILRSAKDRTRSKTEQGLGAQPPLDEAETTTRLRRAITAQGINGLLELFFSHYFFEISIDYLRRPSDDLQFDLSYWYNFSIVGSMVSLGAETGLRKTLAEQCREKARDLIPYVKGRVGKEDIDKVEAHITEALKQIFFVRTRGQWPPPEPGKPFLNVVVGKTGLRSLRKHYQVDDKTIRLRLGEENANVSFSFERLEQFLKSLHEENWDQPVDPLVRDLLDLGVAVYMSDRFTKRERHLGRRIAILMPVRRPDAWSESQVAVKRAVSFLARDDFNIYFTKSRESTRQYYRLPQADDDRRCVCLLSGGIDSVAGALWALQKGLEPIFVSHYASTRLAGAQKKVVAHLETIFRRKLHHISLYVNQARARGKDVESRLGKVPQALVVQHLRTFLFLSLATAVALELGIRKIFIFENGPVALNPLFSEARINTRTAHAHFLGFFQDLIRSVFNVELEIENPFAYLTKGEVTSLLAKREFQKLISETESCWFTFRVWLRAQELGLGNTFSGRHDGDCFPCILRRTAVHHAGLWKKDGAYLVNVFREFYQLPRSTITGIADFLRFCKNTQVLSDSELLLYAPDFAVYAEDVDPQELLKMYRRHSEEVISCFRDRTSEEFRRTFVSILGTSS